MWTYEPNPSRQIQSKETTDLFHEPQVAHIVPLRLEDLEDDTLSLNLTFPKCFSGFRRNENVPFLLVRRKQAGLKLTEAFFSVEPDAH
jgi:hypothetical protein